jgi:hypothetical protein
MTVKRNLAETFGLSPWLGVTEISRTSNIGRPGRRPTG